MCVFHHSDLLSFYPSENKFRKKTKIENPLGGSLVIGRFRVQWRSNFSGKRSLEAKKKHRNSFEILLQRFSSLNKTKGEVVSMITFLESVVNLIKFVLRLSQKTKIWKETNFLHGNMMFRLIRLICRQKSQNCLFFEEKWKKKNEKRFIFKKRICQN